MKLWGGRFEGQPSEVFERFSGSLDFDRRLIRADIRGSQAFARALEQVGILSASERACIVEAFDRILEESAGPAFFEGAADEDVHTLVIRKLEERAGAVADKIHTGRSRNEQVSLDTRLWLREECDRVRALLVGVMSALLDLAGEYPNAVIPGYTHLRRAQAVLWPHYLLAYFEMFARDWERFGDARGRANFMPLGSGALAGSGFPFQREELTNDLDFDGITRNSMDVSGDRDFVLDFLYAASVTRINLSRLAEESWVIATDLAEALARSGTPFHKAHQIVGRFVLESVRSGRKPADWTAEQMQQFAPEFTGEMAALLDPAEGIKSRELPGGTG